MLTEQQQAAEKLILDWYENYRITGKQVFTLAGFAGTGKTFLINEIIKELGLKDNEVAFATPTGKAASVLIQKGREASTIHRLIYDTIEEELEVELNGETLTEKAVDYVKKDEIPKYKLIVIDEVSMVEKDIMKDLLSFAIPLLCTGDLGQLPAIFESNDLLKKPDYVLTKIVRQAEDNPIIKLATMARHKIPIPYGNYGEDVIVIKGSSLKPGIKKKLHLQADQIICGTNKTRARLNSVVRDYKGINLVKHKLPIIGDKVICTVNNWREYMDDNEVYNLVNGTIGFIEKDTEVKDEDINLGALTFKPDFLEEDIMENVLFDTGMFINREASYDMHQHVFLMPNDKYILRDPPGKRKKEEDLKEYRSRIMKYLLASKNSVNEKMINRFEFGYAITVHKSQGSEWDKVIVYDESHIFEEPEKWLYTAITRAKKKLIIIR